MLRTPSVAVLAFACAATATACEQKSSDEQRVARLEKKVDKIIEVLESVLPGKDPDPAATYSPVWTPAFWSLVMTFGCKFACPYCLQAHPIVEQIRQEFPNDVRVVSKYLVVHQPAIPSGLAVCAANKQGKYTEMKNAIKGARLEIIRGESHELPLANPKAVNSMMLSFLEAH